MNGDTKRRWLVLRLEAPLLAFGGVAIDNYGITRDFPSLSLLTGLFANALGWERTERAAHQALQDRLTLAARRDDEPYHGVLRDVQNARLEKSDKGWTTFGAPEGREGASYGGPHRRFRDYHPDAIVTVVCTLRSPLDTEAKARRSPNLNDLATALDWPERPLFIGRKPCLPACRILDGVIEAETAHDALMQPPLTNRSRTSKNSKTLRAQWPVGEGPDHVGHVLRIHDQRDWISGLHSGSRTIVEGFVQPTLDCSEVVSP